ncbi:MAG TPA: ATP-binding protein [Candidatus Cloacimonadota bacterium]|nr:ATP-binding protein [Candidatus Cloacimonadota bacterium]
MLKQKQIVSIELNDDGAGIDLEKIRNLLKKINQEDLEFYEILQSVICKNQSKNPDLLSDEEILPLIFYPGFSTKNQITDISGRGIGLSAVKQEIEKLGGSLTVNTIQNTGTCFVIKLPYIYTPSSLQQDTIFEQTIEQILIQFYLEQTGIQLHKMDSDHQNDLLDYASCIKLEGNKSRIIILTTGSSIMDISFEKMLKDASLNEENESMKQQCLSEILNIICGNALTELEVHDSDLKLHTPYSVKAQAFHFIQNSWPLKRLSYEYQGDKLHIYYA